MPNELIAAMSSVVTEGIKQEIGNSSYTAKVDGPKDKTVVEHIFINIVFFNERSLKVAERLLVSSSTNLSDAKSITDVILEELTKAGLTSTETLGQVSDVTFVMIGHCGEVQRLLQEGENEIFLCAMPEPSISPCSGARNVGCTSDQ